VKKETNVDVTEMIDQLVKNAQEALAEYMKLDQEQVDLIVHAKILPFENYFFQERKTSSKHWLKILRK
ncbi:MAG: hypothetical protein PHW83_10325, partial [Bacteroidales bacterium]|nr:hypothetical protein [Bacteroidales bacterium]